MKLKKLLLKTSSGSVSFFQEYKTHKVLMCADIVCLSDEMMRR